MRDDGRRLDEVLAHLREEGHSLGPAELARPSRGAGRTVGDVLYHQLLDARRALVTSRARPTASRTSTK